MTSQRILVKIGGSTLGQEDTTLQDLVWLQQQGHQPIVVHGGGKVITEWLERIQLPTRFVHGLRVTDEDSIDVVVAVLAGVVNKRLVRDLNALGGRAVGVSGVDGGLLRAKQKDPSLGLVGEIVSVDTACVEVLLDGGFLPVIAPIGQLTEGGSVMGSLVNINADTVAARIGAAMGVSQCIFLTDVPGVIGSDGDVVSRLTRGEARELMASGVIAGGMIPKVESCLRALAGVTEAHIADGRRPHALRDSAAGTSAGTRIS
ncbi:MAG: acetylglutamate kinase [Chloroflexi bacterium]|nr:acetylglutamate kinase [Chloroflexota bacterium]